MGLLDRKQDQTTTTTNQLSTSITDQTFADAQTSIEAQWLSISKNFQTVIDHLGKCSDQVSKASVECLTALDHNIDSTCDSITKQMESLYRLISKCDELSINLKLIEDFREEIRTLRKSVETLEALFKARPRSVQGLQAL